MSDGAKPGPGGWNHIHFVVDNLESEIARMRADGVKLNRPGFTGGSLISQGD
jgi:catechol 2,3-dioxygenase-like lactoylglutathione lyase family enzyme